MADKLEPKLFTTNQIYKHGTDNCFNLGDLPIERFQKLGLLNGIKSILAETSRK
jgi:hypothetical protein